MGKWLISTLDNGVAEFLKDLILIVIIITDSAQKIPMIMD